MNLHIRGCLMRHYAGDYIFYCLMCILHLKDAQEFGYAPFTFAPFNPFTFMDV